MANAKISNNSVFVPETNISNIDGLAGFTGSGNVKISGTALVTSLETNLNLSSFTTGTLAVTRGGTGANTFTDHGILIGNATNAVSATAELANGQLLIGSTGNAPVPATLTQGTDISITDASGSITIDHAAVTNAPTTNSTTLSAGGTFTAINSVNVSAQGHLTAQNTETYTLPSDTNTTYDLTAPSIGVLRLSGSDATTDNVSISASNGITISQLAANNINVVGPNLPTGANPSAAITGTVSNGSATTFMRSDAVPALSNEITIGDVNNRGLVDIEGGNNLDAQLRLNCSAGTHAVTIEGPAHLNGINYIVKLPTRLPAAGNLLEVDTYAANGGGSDYNNPPLATMKWSNPSQLVTQSLIVAASDETTDLSTGTAKSTFRMPYAFTLSAVRASVTTAPTGSTIIVNIKESGTTILSSRITIDPTEKTSVTATSQPVISDTALADDAEITVDIDQVGSTVAGTGLKITLIGTKA